MQRLHWIHRQHLRQWSQMVRRCQPLAQWSAVAALLAVTGGAIGGCAQVDVRSDFESTTQRVSERTGVADVYNPAAEAMIAPRINDLLIDGLTIDEAVSVALLNNPAFQSLFQTIGASRADVVQSGLLSNPTLFFSARFPEGGGRSSLNFSFAQQLVDLWQIPVRKRIAEADLERTVNAVSLRAVELAADVTSKYIMVLALQRTEQIAEDNNALAERSLRLAQVRLDAGETNPIDVNLVRSHYFEVQQLLIAIRRDLRKAELDLSAAMGLIRRPGGWTLASTLDALEAGDIGDVDLMSHACEERFDLRIAESQIRSAEAQLDLEHLQVFPSVSLGLEAERPDQRTIPGRTILADTARASVAAGAPAAPSIDSRAQRRLIKSQIVDFLSGPSIQVTLPVWDQNQAQITKSRYMVVQLVKQYESLLDLTTREVQQARIDADAARALVEFFEKKTLPQARENVEIIRVQYENGEQSILFLIEAQEFLLQQSRAYVEALRASALAVTELRRAVGGRLPVAPATQPAASQTSDSSEFDNSINHDSEIQNDDHDE